MGLLPKLFGGRSGKVYADPQSGTFTLQYSKGGTNLWVRSDSELSLTARGSTFEPHKEHLRFLSNAVFEIEQLHEAISQRFVYEFEVADLEVTFSDWKEMFKLVAVDIEKIVQGTPYWMATFEELNKPYAHFNLYFEGRAPKGISMDT